MTLTDTTRIEIPYSKHLIIKRALADYDLLKVKYKNLNLKYKALKRDSALLIHQAQENDRLKERYSILQKEYEKLNQLHNEHAKRIGEVNKKLRECNQTRRKRFVPEQERRGWIIITSALIITNVIVRIAF